MCITLKDMLQLTMDTIYHAWTFMLLDVTILHMPIPHHMTTIVLLVSNDSEKYNIYFYFMDRKYF